MADAISKDLSKPGVVQSSGPMSIAMRMKMNREAISGSTQQSG
jgi:hypothetical protein